MVLTAKTPNPKLNNDVVDKRFRTPTRTSARTPLLPKEAENAPRRRLRSIEVTSRFLSSSKPTTLNSTTSSSSTSAASASRRYASPIVERTVTPVQSSTVSVRNSVSRAQSTERRRPGTPWGVTTEMSSAAKQLVTSARSLSVSFQGRSFSMPTSVKPASSGVRSGSSVRKETPERRKTTPARDQRENLNSKPSDQQLWPGRLRAGNMNHLTRSMDFSATAAIGNRINGKPRGVKAMESFSSPLDKPRSRPEIKLNSTVNNFVLETKVDLSADANSVMSDSDSVSSGSSPSLKGRGSLLGGPRGIVVQSRYWQDSNRFWRGSESSSPTLKADGSIIAGSPRFSDTKKLKNVSMVSSPRVVSTRTELSSPHSGSRRPASPSKFVSSAASNFSRGMPSPIRTRTVVSNEIGSIPSISSFAADIRRGKMGENRVADEHDLKLLYNRHFQWRFVNARAAATLQDQTRKIQEKLYNAWLTTRKLRNTLQSEKVVLQLRRQILKLSSVLEGQVPFLENWESIGKDYCNCLSGIIEALEASVVCMPITGGATANIQDVENAVYSALNVLQKVESSTGALLTEVEEADSLLSELSSTATNAKDLLYECKDLLAQLTAIEVKDFSLRAHLLQLSRFPPMEEQN